MKCILVWWSYTEQKFFDTLARPMSAFEFAKLNIDNMLELGWQCGDIIVATNFDWEYRGVKTTRLYNAARPKFRNATSSKVTAIKELLDRNLLDEETVYWFHDLDVLQTVMFEPPNLTSEVPLGLIPFINLGEDGEELYGTTSMFFRTEVKPMIDCICYHLFNRHVGGKDENSILLGLIKCGYIQAGRDFLPLNRAYTYNYKPTIRQGRGKGQEHFPELIANIEHPVKAVDFNYSPIRRERIWRRFLSVRMQKLLYERHDNGEEEKKSGKPNSTARRPS